MEIRTYTKQELASHYSKWSKSFMPRQVRLIVKYLGEL
ncbi:MAG: DUF4248 domain-containing protein [Prevotella sp.]|nr:DUF4248 domain-containing protein [Prevotella sp.]